MLKEHVLLPNAIFKGNVPSVAGVPELFSLTVCMPVVVKSPEPRNLIPLTALDSIV